MKTIEWTGRARILGLLLLCCAWMVAGCPDSSDSSEQAGAQASGPAGCPPLPFPIAERGDLQLPRATTSECVTDAPAIVITSELVLLDDEPAVQLDQRRVRPSDLGVEGNASLIAPLHSELGSSAEVQKVVARARGTTFQGIANILVDARTPPPTLAVVRSTAESVGFTDLRYVVALPGTSPPQYGVVRQPPL